MLHGDSIKSAQELAPKILGASLMKEKGGLRLEREERGFEGERRRDARES